MQKALLLIIHGQHNQKFSKDQLERHFPDHLHQLTFAMFQSLCSSSAEH